MQMNTVSQRPVFSTLTTHITVDSSEKVRYSGAVRFPPKKQACKNSRSAPQSETQRTRIVSTTFPSRRQPVKGTGNGVTRLPRNFFCRHMHLGFLWLQFRRNPGPGDSAAKRCPGSAVACGVPVGANGPGAQGNGLFGGDKGGAHTRSKAPFPSDAKPESLMAFCGNV